MTPDDLAAVAERVSNAGRWGLDDELGTLNFVVDAVRLAALSEVRRGRAYSLAKDLDTAAGTRGDQPAALVVLPGADEDRTVRDELTVAPHGFATTHADAVGHCFLDGQLYNGRPAASAVSARGLEFGSILAQRDGVITRGVLLDVAGARGVQRLEPGTPVTPADLDAAEQLAGVRVRSGDAVVVRVGTGTAADPVHDDRGQVVRAGLSAHCLVWLHEREVAVYSGDCVDLFPSPYPDYPDFFHQVALGRMGLALLDGPDVEHLARLCASEGSATFLLVYAPLRIRFGTGSAVNPLAVF